jgi:hypothetical protein
MGSSGYVPVPNKGVVRVLIGALIMGAAAAGLSVFGLWIAGAEPWSSAAAASDSSTAIKTLYEFRDIAGFATICYVLGAFGAYVRTRIGLGKHAEAIGSKGTIQNDQLMEARALVGGFFGFLSCLALQAGILQAVVFENSSIELDLKVSIPGYLLFASLSGLLSTELFSSLEGAVHTQTKPNSAGGKDNGR